MAASSKSRLALAAKHAAHVRAQRKEIEPINAPGNESHGSDNADNEGVKISAADWCVGSIFNAGCTLTCRLPGSQCLKSCGRADLQ
jgi:hypothetical protein